MSRQDLSKLAMNARRRLRNAEADKARMGQRALAVVVGGGAAAAMGYIMGGLSQEAGAGSGGEDDPTLLFGLNLDLVAGLGITTIGVLMGAKSSTRRYGEYVEAAGTGILSGFAYTYGYSIGEEKEEE